MPNHSPEDRERRIRPAAPPNHPAGKHLSSASDGSTVAEQVGSGQELFRARALVLETSRRCAMLSGAMALRREAANPPAPAGLAAIWRLQAAMVAEIGNVFRARGRLLEESFFDCVFRHAAAQLLSEFVVQIGETLAAASSRAAEEPRGREPQGPQATPRKPPAWLPLLGAIAVAAYAYYDTSRVGKNAVEFFRSEMKLE